MNIQSLITGEQTPLARYGHPPEDARIAIGGLPFGSQRSVGG